MSKYQIIKGQLPLVGGLGGHNFVVFTDPTGKVIAVAGCILRTIKKFF